MITKMESLLEVLGAPNTQLAIPVYQRVYAWSAAQCDAFWGDVMRAGKTGREHFLGTVLYGESRTGAAGQRVVDLVDGQQRMATTTLMIAALRDYLLEEGGLACGLDARAIEDRYLRLSDGGACATACEGDAAVNPGDGFAPYDAQACKLQLSRFDRATLQAVIDGADLPEGDERSVNVVENYRMFRERMQAGFDVDALWRGLELLVVISAVMEEGDRPQLVFESLNSKGRPLSTADLVRNLLLANVSLDKQEELHYQYWAPIEEFFDEGLDSPQFAAALRGWLAIKAPALCKNNSDEVYALFKTYVETEHTGSIEELLFGLKGFFQSFVTRSQSSGARIADSHNSYGVAKVEGIISEKKLFGD